MDTKPCTFCAEIKPLSEFWKNNRTSDGHQGKCRTCVNEYKRTRRDLAASQEATRKEIERKQKAAVSASIGEQRYWYHRGQADRIKGAMGSLVAHHEAEAAKYESYIEVQT